MGWRDGGARSVGGRVWVMEGFGRGEVGGMRE